MSADLFDLTGRVVIITGGAGLLGRQHAETVAGAGGHPVIADLDSAAAAKVVDEVSRASGVEALAIGVDVTSPNDVQRMTAETMTRFGRIDVLINNAALTVKGGGERSHLYFSKFEDYPLDLWEKALDINLTGTFLCCQSVGKQMVAQQRGVILNIASDVGTISPDHRIYEGVAFNTPPAYATTKAGVISLSRYLATYWAKDNIRVNALSPGGVFNDQDPQFVSKVTNLIPLGRMARRDEYRGAVLYLISDASSYVTGSNVIVDGGRTAW